MSILIIDLAEKSSSHNGIYSSGTLSSTMSSNHSSTMSSLASSSSSLNSPLQLNASTSSLTYDSLKSLGARVVAHHMCQADNNITCMVPEFVHSVSAYMARAPQLLAYRELLIHEPHLQNLLSMRMCIQNPSLAFVKGVLEPLANLKRSGKITADMCVILVDSLNEAEFHKPDYGYTIASFLSHHIAQFPSWLKLIVTVRTVLQELTKFLPFHRINLDKMVLSEYIHKDLHDYINHRIYLSDAIRNNIAPNAKMEATTQLKFSGHVQTLSRGCFLYCKLLMDLIERGHLVLKSSNYKILPVNLSEVFLLMFNLKFPSLRSFEKVCPILNVCLATLYPLTMGEVYEAINSGFVGRYVSYEDFVHRMDALAGFLLQRKDSSFMFFHPAFREWLIRREEADTSKFLCDLR